MGHEEVGLWTDGRYFVQARIELEGTGIRLFEMEEPEVPTIFQYIKDNIKENEVIGFDGKVIDTIYGTLFEDIAKEKNASIKYGVISV